MPTIHKTRLPNADLYTHQDNDPSLVLRPVGDTSGPRETRAEDIMSARPGRLAEVRAKIAVLREKAGDLASLTEITADRLLGPEPQTGVEADALACSEGEIATIMLALNELDMVLSDAMHNTNRLSTV